MRNKRGVALMAAGALLLTGAIAVTLLNFYNEEQAEAQSGSIVLELREHIPEYSAPQDQTSDPVATPQIEDSAEPEGSALQTIEPADGTIQTMVVEGNAYIGVLDIPALSLSLPILQDWSYDLLKIAPCRYAGSFLDNSMVIAGHNYKAHFGALSRLETGDSVIFTDVIGAVYTYEVVSVETLEKTSVDEMVSGDWDLTLFTCTTGGTARVAVRCELQ